MPEGAESVPQQLSGFWPWDAGAPSWLALRGVLSTGTSTMREPNVPPGTSPRLLLIAPRFFGYDDDIAGGLLSVGWQVDRMLDRPFEKPLLQAASKVASGVMARMSIGYYERSLASLGRTHYAAILVVNGQTVHSDVLRRLRSLYPAAKLILYMWDSIANRPGLRERLGLFDVCYSFDPESAREFGMKLRPLFFGPQFEINDDPKEDIDISFVGTMHSDRYSIVSRLRKTLPAGLNCYWYLYLQAPWVFWLRSCVSSDMRAAGPREFQFQSLPKAAVRSIFARSRSVLDIEHPMQRGLTMRTFETVGSRKKLITTNTAVRDYDFYDPSNIAVIERSAPIVPAEFFFAPFRPLSHDVYRKYSLSGWVSDVAPLPGAT